MATRPRPAFAASWRSAFLISLALHAGLVLTAVVVPSWKGREPETVPSLDILPVAPGAETERDLTFREIRLLATRPPRQPAPPAPPEKASGPPALPLPEHTPTPGKAAAGVGPGEAVRVVPPGGGPEKGGAGARGQ